MLRTLKLFLLSSLTVMFTGCDIRSDLDYCGVYLEFIYDYNMAFTDVFGQRVPTVDVYIFDSEGKYLFCKQANCPDELIDGKLMFLNELDFGTYTVLTVGGLCDQFNFSDCDGNPCVEGITTVEEMQLALARASDEVSHEFPYIWHGRPVEIEYTADQTIYPVHLIQNTNKFSIMLSRYGEDDRVNSNESRADINEIGALYHFEIVTPEGGVYAYDNSPLSEEIVTYTPYDLRPGINPGAIAVGQLNTARLLHQPSDYRLVVRKTETWDVIWDYDLMEILSYTKFETRPDGSAIPMQEYLDRQHQWNIIILYEGGDELGIVGVTIEKCPWVLWLYDIEF